MDQDKKTVRLGGHDGLKDLEKKISADEQRPDFKIETEKVPEKKEVLKYEKAVSEELRREIEVMEMEDGLKEEAKKKAQKIEFLGEEEKIEHLLEIAKEKGVVYAVQVAIRMNDPYILDVLHDVLAKEGYYKEFLK